MSQTMGRYVKANRTLCTSVPVLNITYTNQKTHENIQRFLSIILKHRVQGGWEITVCSNVAPACGSDCLIPVGATATEVPVHLHSQIACLWPATITPCNQSSSSNSTMSISLLVHFSISLRIFTSKKWRNSTAPRDPRNQNKLTDSNRIAHMFIKRRKSLIWRMQEQIYLSLVQPRSLSITEPMTYAFKSPKYSYYLIDKIVAFQTVYDNIW